MRESKDSFRPERQEARPFSCFQAGSKSNVKPWTFQGPWKAGVLQARVYFTLEQSGGHSKVLPNTEELNVTVQYNEHYAFTCKFFASDLRLSPVSSAYSAILAVFKDLGHLTIHKLDE
eukprot:1251953-Amphidinium_carterae.1